MLPDPELEEEEEEEAIVPPVRILERTKEIQLSKRKYALIMCYLCPMDNVPLLAYWKMDTKVRATRGIVGKALKDSGFGAYRFFEEEDGQGIEYNVEEDAKKRHMHQEEEEYGWKAEKEIVKSWSIYMQLNPIVTVNNFLIAAIRPQLIGLPEGHQFISDQDLALNFIERMRHLGLPLFIVIDDICDHGKPIFYFEPMQWSKRFGSYAREWERVRELVKLFSANLVGKLDFGEDEDILVEFKNIIIKQEEIGE